MIRIDSIWLATEPMDMRAGTETALARRSSWLLDGAGYRATSGLGTRPALATRGVWRRNHTALTFAISPLAHWSIAASCLLWQNSGHDLLAQS